ncbi:hypothetical protein SAMN05877753_10220 [Bacillus oleivorans]|uniref:Large polyvalent protein associated domain-containing protein n=2 Tax=Bacillus oleivorans TaxID=1448271 RepID=A0A285CLD1_9BACI|nr:hypothetical protein SAMN05877753_10220 [Bacillus oleivorans]
MSGSSSISDFFNRERERILSGERTQFESIRDQATDAARFAGRYSVETEVRPSDVKVSPSKPTKEELMKQAQDQIINQGVGDWVKGSTKPKKDKNKYKDDNFFIDSQQWLYDHTLGPVQDWFNRAAFQGVDNLTGKTVSSGAEKYELPKEWQEDYLSKADTPMEKAADIVGTVGVSAPLYFGGYGVLGASRVGQGLTQWGGQNAVKRGLSEAAKGSIVGGTVGTGIEIGQELMNPSNQNLPQHLLDIGIDIAGGAVLDPLAYGIQAGVRQGFQGLRNTVDNAVPREQLAQNFARVMDTPSTSNAPRPSQFNELMPTARDITNPNYVRPIVQNQSLEPIVNSPFQRFNPEVAASTPTNSKVQQVDQAQTTPAQPLNTQPNVVNLASPRQTPDVFGQPSSTPIQPSSVPNERRVYQTIKQSEKTTQPLREGLETMDTTYQRLSNQELVDYANELINRDIEKAFQFVKNAKRMDPRHTTVAFRLIDELQARGQHERALDLVEQVAEYGTKAGQSVQALSIYNRLSPQGQLVRLQRTVNRINQNRGINQEKVVITEDFQKDFVATAQTIQALTGQEQVGKNVIDIVQRLKKGQAPTDEEAQIIRDFFEDAKKFVSDLDPKAKPPKVKPVKDTRSRDKVVSFMAKQEELARKRIQARRNAANSLPIDLLYDYGVIGASKIAKGTVKFTDFSEQMIREFGEEIRPYMQQIYNKAAETFNLQTEKITTKRLTQAEKVVDKAIREKTLSPDMADELLRLSKQLLDATGDAKFDASMELQAALVRLEQPTFAQMIASTHYQAMLLNPLTVIRNIIGNEVFYRIDRASKLLTVPIDAIRSKITGAKRTIVFNTGQFNWKNYFDPTRDYWKGMKMGGKAGWKGVNPLGINTAYDLRSPAFSSNAQNLGPVKKMLVSKYNPLRWTEKLLGVTMRSFDTAGYLRAYNQMLREQATLRAMNEGLKGRALREAADRYFLEADENLMAIADQYGKYATFQDNTALARGLTKVKEGANKLSTKALTLGMAETKDFGLGSLILPFPKTPANLVMRALEYSPAGLIRSVNLIKNYLRMGKNPLDAREAQLALSRAIIGTGGLSGLGFILAEKGVLTSAGHSDYEVRELERMAGKQPNSINISALERFVFNGFNLSDLELRRGDTFVSYDWAQPLALSIALGTGISQANKESENPTVSQKIIRAGDSAINTIVNMSSLSGINRIVSGPPNETWSEKLAGSMASAGGSFVPTLANQFRKAGDNTARNTNDPTFKEVFQNRALNRIPGYQQQLPPSYNTFGEKEELYPNQSNNLFNVFLNPSYVSQYNPSEEAQVLLDYINQTGDKTAAPRLAPKTLDGYKLTGEEQSEMQRIMGEETKKGIQEQLERLRNASPEKAEKIIDDILREASARAREVIREGRE